MKIQQSRFVKNNGIKALLVFFLEVVSARDLSANAPNSAVPSPVGGYYVNLLESPSPASLSMHAMPFQQAQVNSPFYFKVTPFIGLSPLEIRYRVTNGYMNSGTVGISGSITGMVGVPAGLTHISNGLGDCRLNSEMVSLERCVLRFQVEPSKYARGDGFGPSLAIHLCWNWGSKYRRPACLDTNTIPIVSERVNAVLAAPLLPPRGVVTPIEQDGLYFDSATQTIQGIPTRTGVYSFFVSASNTYSTAAPRELQINVGIDIKDKPVFKNNYTLASAIPKQHYQLNLLDLIKPKESFMVTNQVHFRIDPNHSHPDWLSIDESNTSLLQGHVPLGDAGQKKEVTIIASSNTGGDSLPQTITIPIALDPAKKPIIRKRILLQGEAGTEFYSDLQGRITDPTADSNLKLVIDKIEPPASWLRVSAWRPTQIEGIVPQTAVGQIYQISLHANTEIGGDSKTVTIPLRILIDKSKTPQFYDASPHFPIFYTGQSYVYDFVANNDIHPEYLDIPYTIELAKGYKNPAWLRIEDNKLIVDKVPENLNQVEKLFITIKNVPGGQSEVFYVDLQIEN